MTEAFKSPYVQEFGKDSPDVEEFSQSPNNTRNPPKFNPLLKPSQFKTPESDCNSEDIKEQV